MFERVQQYAAIEVDGRWYRPKAYADPHPDGTWDGWLVFFPVAGGTAVAPPNRETTQSSLPSLAVWAAGLTPIYLEGALARALRHAEQSYVLSRLTDAEYEALDDAERLEAAAEVERTAAEIDEAAASAARAEAEQIQRERLATDRALAAAEEAAANVEATLHDQAAREAREVAADAGRRSREAASTRPKRTKGRSAKKK